MPPAHLSHGWLPAVLPADATRVRVCDASLAYTLRMAGAEIVEQGADVEVGTLEEISSAAPVAIVRIDSRVSESRNRVRQIVGRVAASADVRLRSAEAAAALSRRGFTDIQVVWWDRDQAIRLPGVPRSSSRLADAFPRCVLIVAARARPGPTVLDRAVADAERRTGLRLENARPLVSSGTLVVRLERHVLRVALGPACQLIDRQASALAVLRSLSPVAAVAARVPGLLATGAAGIGGWSLEQRLPGVNPPWVLTPRLLNASLEFLVALSSIGSTESSGFMRSRVDRLIEAACLSPAVLAGLREVAADVDEEVEHMPHAFFHGDFSTQNLLVCGDELAGVVDWAQADRAGLPLLDVLNLELLNGTQPDIYDWGPSLTGYLLPLVRRGGSEAMRRYARAIGVAFSARQLECLVYAYWMDRVTHQLVTYVDRTIDRLWLERNLIGVLSAGGVACR